MGVPTDDQTIATKEVGHDVHSEENRSSVSDDDVLVPPTEEELRTLRKVPGPMAGTGYWLCIVEFAERASYYSCKHAFSNFIQYPLPAGGNGAGAPPRGSELNAGGLGKGLQVSSALTLLFSFLAYALPLLGGYIADVHLGRYKTICIGIAVAGLGHLIMIFSALPSVLQAGHGLAPFTVSIIVLAIGSGLFKSNIFPTVMDQIKHQEAYVKVTKKGERVIVDPETTIDRVTVFYYALINVGAFFAVATTYAENRVGYWLAYLFPTIIYFLTPIVLAGAYKKTIKKPPSGSVLADTFKVTRTAIKRNGWLRIGRSGYLDAARPSSMVAAGHDTTSITWTDGFVEDVSRTFKACMIFVFFPIYLLSDGGIGNALTNQAGSMTKNGAPNDLLSNFNALSIIVMSPILGYIVYPLLRRYKITIPPVTKICIGFMLGAISSMVSSIVQWRVYKTSPCGYHASTCDQVSPVSVWWQAPIFWIGGTSELFAMTTSYELAYALSPVHMKGLVMAVCLFMSAISAAISEACTGVLVDPHLIWALAAPAVATVVATVLMWVCFRSVDKQTFLRAEDPAEKEAAAFAAEKLTSEHDAEKGKEAGVMVHSNP